ncbi:unnamed protein product [Urochloa humidicola]
MPDFVNCSNLKVLWVDGNNLVGWFPAFPSGLQELQLSRNNLSGTIPASLSNITNLMQFGCGHNNILGSIPQQFSMLRKLKGLYVNANLLAGSFPEAILNLSTLNSLALPMNHFGGELPSNLGSALPNLESLLLAGNFFHGHIPSSLTNASNMNEIDISRNNFSGIVPRSIGKLTKLTKLNLEMNKLQARNKQEWEFLDSLTNCTELYGISVALNQLEGQLPSSLGNLTIRLQYLYLQLNQLSGEIPFGIANLRNLIHLGLGGNQFTGMVPDWLGTLRNVQTMTLASNMFTGPIPSSLSNLSQMVQLFLRYNQFGQIPSSLGNLPMLNLLDVSNNLLHGVIPTEIFGIPTVTEIDLSSNNLNGKLPKEVGNAKQLVKLVLSSNNLSGDIPNTLGNCESLEYVMLDQNTFNGSIPTSLGNIRSLQVLNLSSNSLTGSIPVSLGNLQFIEQLDFSFNHLMGEVPKVFRNVSAVRIAGNPGLCGGPLELRLLPCSVMPLKSNKHKQSTVQKVVIPLACIVVLVVVSVLLIWWRNETKPKSISAPTLQNKIPKISYGDLAKATNGFSSSNLIGKGRCSFVYQGELFRDRTLVAIKVLSLEIRGAQKSFIAECHALRNLRHRNLVPLITACSSIDSNGNDFKALVYKFMPRGDLHTLLYSTEDGHISRPRCITLMQMLSIVVNIADALEYLHHSNQEIIVHCDLKPSNILLDETMTAHLGDFGLTRFKVDSSAPSFGDSISNSSIALKGTIGYIAPEYAAGGEVSRSADVYSFGIVLLEIFLRRRPTDDMFNEGLNIVRFVEVNFPGRISDIVDPELLEEQHDLLPQNSAAMKLESLECILSVLNIGLRCTNPSPNERMSMQEVAARLRGISDGYLKGN